MRFEADTHSHTLASGHAYSTIKEMAAAAEAKGLKALALTEHAPKMPGTCGLFYFQNLDVVPRKCGGIRLLMGAEVNIMDETGRIDLPGSGYSYCEHSSAMLWDGAHRRGKYESIRGCDEETVY